MSITYCIPSKNNLRYLIPCIKSIRENSHYDNEIIVYVDQDEDGTEKWLIDNKVKHFVNNTGSPKGIGHAYDTMFKAATFDKVVAFHADMILGKDADINALKHHSIGKVVCSTRIEPPLHPTGPEKMTMDFGMWPEEIKWKEFDAYVKHYSTVNSGKTTKSMFAPWLIDRRNHLGHDPLFLSVYEDADLFRRFVLAGYELVQSWDSLVYHLTCRGGQFAGATKMEDFKKKDEAWLRNNQISMLEYVRKWGGLFKEYGPCEPRPNKKYDVGIKLTNCTHEALTFEPYFNSLSVDIDASEYIKEYQQYSKFDLSSKFVKELKNDIVIEVDCSLPEQVSTAQTIIQNLEDYVDSSELEPNNTYWVSGVLIKAGTLQKEIIQIDLWN